MQQLEIAYLSEGETDVRFLRAIIRRTFEDILQREGKVPIEVLEPTNFGKGNLEHVQEIHDQLVGYRLICIHTDADAREETKAFQERIQPLINELRRLGGVQQKALEVVPIVPVQMTEAWMLADKALLKEEIQTTKNDQVLKLNIRPELPADPKVVIEEAIRLADAQDRVQIGELYEPLGQIIALEKLKHLPSYKRFYERAVNGIRQLNLIH